MDVQSARNFKESNALYKGIEYYIISVAALYHSLFAFHCCLLLPCNWECIGGALGTHQGCIRDAMGMHQWRIGDALRMHQGHIGDASGTHWRRIEDVLGTHRGRIGDVFISKISKLK